MSDLQTLPLTSAAPGVRVLQWVNHVLITAFAVSSGVFKLLGGEADVKLYGAIGIGVTAMAAIGAVQALGGVALIFPRTRNIGAGVAAATNLLASGILFANHVQPFGAISLVFVAMALLEMAFRPARVR
jgi:hypothetical protein